MYSTIEEFMDAVKVRNSGEAEFHQAVHEVVESLWDFLKDNPHHPYAALLVIW